MPPVALKDLSGKTVNLEEFKGKVILLNFWAQWCAPCLAEIPELIKWQNQYGNQGLQIIGITYPPTDKKDVRRFARQNKINYPVLFGSKETKKLFNSGDTLPYSVVIDSDGNIKERIEGVIFTEEFDEKIKPLLKESKKSIRQTISGFSDYRQPAAIKTFVNKWSAQFNLEREFYQIE